MKERAPLAKQVHSEPATDNKAAGRAHLERTHAAPSARSVATLRPQGKRKCERRRAYSGDGQTRRAPKARQPLTAPRGHHLEQVPQNTHAAYAISQRTAGPAHAVSGSPSGRNHVGPPYSGNPSTKPALHQGHCDNFLQHARHNPK